MLRLTLLLCLGMFAALMVMGEDRGQLRPGLALAESEGRLDEVWAEARAKRERAEAVALQASAEPEPAPVLAEVAPPSRPLAEATQPSRPVVEEAPVIASAETATEPARPREVVQVLDEPVFSLSSFGNEPVPGEEAGNAETASTAEPEPAPLADGEGTIWYVNANSVNVRSAPSTDSEVQGKLGTGEAVLVVAAVDDEWARIVIQGDGLEGFVALRFLSPEAP